MVLWFVVSILAVASKTEGTVTAHEFQVVEGYVIEHGTEIRQVIVEGMSALLCASHCTQNCHTATFSVTHNTCVTYHDKLYSMSLTWQSSSAWSVLYKSWNNEMIQHDANWTMVFKAQSGINQRVYNTWQAVMPYHDLETEGSSVPIGCLRLDTAFPCTRHSRSQILDNWSNIVEVRFSLYKNGQQTQFITFDASGADRSSWFQQSRIIDSSWTDIKTNNLPFFSIDGYVVGNDDRRFYISEPFYGCPGDLLYTVTFDNVYTDGCYSYWALPGTAYPMFLYSKGPSVVQPALKDYDLAEVLAVFVRFSA